MKGDYLYKQEMLRKGIKSCIIWMVIIIVFTGIVYMLSLYLMPDSARGKLSEGGVSRPFSVPFYKCPVEIEIEIVGLANATFHLTWENNETDYQKKFIARNGTGETRTFSYEGELERGNYILLVKPVNSKDPNLTETKVDFGKINVYILEPLMLYIFIGAGIIEGLLAIWLVSIIIRRRNVVKEMIKANTGKKSGDDYFSRLNEDRSASKHTEYDELFPKDDGMTSFEKSKSKQYTNDASGLYANDYEMRKQRKSSPRGGARSMRDREFEREIGHSSAETRSERGTHRRSGESRHSHGGWERSDDGSAGRRGVGERSRKGLSDRSRKGLSDRGRRGEGDRSRRTGRERDRSGREDRSRKRRAERSASYDIEYIPPSPRGSPREDYPSERSFDHFSEHKPVRRYERREKEEDGIDWGGSDENDDYDDYDDYDDPYY